MSTITRRDAIKTGTALVLGATLAEGTVESGAAGQQSRERFERILAWEDALAAADKQGAAWVERAWLAHLQLKLAVELAERDTDLPMLLSSLRPLLAEVETVYLDRRDAYRLWSSQAWHLPDLGLLPPRPWA